MPAITIKLLLPDGDPQGLRVAEMGNWSGKALAAPRTLFDDLLKRPELTRTGVYCLTGGIDGEIPEAYIGEAETLANRLRNHREREFWTQAHVFLSKDDTLNKSHARFLEGRLIEDVQRAGRWKLHNAQPSGAKLSESDTAEMGVFYTHMRQLLPLLGCNLFPAETASVREWLTCSIKGFKARGARSSGGFTVAAGSEAVADLRESAAKHAPWLVKLRTRLIADGSLELRGTHFVFTRDVEVASPSAAAALVRGGNANGQTEWRDADGRTLGEIEAAD